MYIKHYFNAKLVTHTHISYFTKKPRKNIQCELKYVHIINCCKEFCFFLQKMIVKENNHSRTVGNVVAHCNL